MAGRKKKNTVDYFPHYIGQGKKIQYIEAKYGNDGYATWFKILESLAVTEDHFINLNDDVEAVFLANKCKVSKEVLFAILNDLAMLGTINKILWENRVVWSEVFMESIKDAYRRRISFSFSFDNLCRHLVDINAISDNINSISDGINRGKKKEEIEREIEIEKRKRNPVGNPDKKSGVENKIATKKPTVQHQCRLIFEEFYLENFKEQYYYKKIDAGNLKNLLKSIDFKIKEKNKIDVVPEEKTIDGFKFFLSRALETSDQFIKGNFTISILYSKFNEIYLKFSNHGKQQVSKSNSESRQQRVDEVADLGSLAKQIIANGG